MSHCNNVCSEICLPAQCFLVWVFLVFCCCCCCCCSFICFVYFVLVDETGCPRMEREGWDCTFTEDVKLIKQTLLSHRNTASVGELLGGFFSFYADIGLPYSVICPRTGIIHNVLQFRKAAQHEEKLKAFKVSSEYNYLQYLLFILPLICTSKKHYSSFPVFVDLSLC